MGFPTEVMPQKRRLLITTGVIVATCEWAAAVGAWYSIGQAKTLFGGIALFLGLSLFILGFFRPGGIGGRAFVANIVACTVIDGATFLGFFLFEFGPLTGAIMGLVAAPIIGLALAVRQTWPLGLWSR